MVVYIVDFHHLLSFLLPSFVSVAPEEKAVWAARADEDKARYLQELAEYVPPPGYDAKGDSVIQFPAASGRRKNKKERDPNAPKRAKSAYLLYQNAMRDQFRTENPGMT